MAKRIYCGRERTRGPCKNTVEREGDMCNSCLYWAAWDEWLLAEGVWYTYRYVTPAGGYKNVRLHTTEEK